MSRVGKKPVELPKGVEVTIASGGVKVKGPKGELSMNLSSQVDVKVADGKAQVIPRSEERSARVVYGTTRALIANMVSGVTKGFEKKMELVGVGYRAQAQGRKLNLNLGYSHPIVYDVPAGITIETPSQTEIIVKGADRQKIGQVCAEIRRYRSPEPYKGKGVRFAGEHIELKEAKKK
ncbi:MAG: 50S ribosomal protein L6 [Gammaproteobacteria bacterium]|nr:50S ribosomal protein L6 [Gammaproteobacteria bacterium]